MKTDVKNPSNKREEKQKVNISWNSRLFFQIGIIVSCLLVLIVMQMSFKMDMPSYTDNSKYELEEQHLVNYQIDVDKPKPIAAVKKPKVKTAPIQKLVTSLTNLEKDNSNDKPESLIASTDIPIDEPVGQDKSAPKDPAPTALSNILNVEFVPVYPGCESLSSNGAKIDCLSEKINLFINRNFRKSYLEELENGQVQKIYVQFKIDSQGYVTDVRANSRNEKLKVEAQRVISKLPKMKPGRQGDKNVDVLYTIPIIFQIH